MSEEIKAVELEDDELEAVSGGTFSWDDLPPREYGASCQKYKMAPGRAIPQEICYQSCFSCMWFRRIIEDDAPQDGSDVKFWECKLKLTPQPI